MSWVKRSETFDGVFFPEAILRAAVAAMPSATAETTKMWSQPAVTTGSVSWTFNDEDEYFAEYGPNVDTAMIHVNVQTPSEHYHMPSIDLTADFWYTRRSYTVTVTGERSAVLRVFGVFRNAVDECRLPQPARVTPPPPPLKIFIGHGRSQHYRDLKDSLQDHHGYQVETFETSPRGGFTIPEVIESMANNSSLALLVMTAEDQQADGSVRARENVVHEIGYFQGKLGRRRAIVLMEEGVNEFSNIHGIVHLPYRNIREVVGDVLAIIRREFPNAARAQ